METHIDVPVLIVGGGIVGLSASLFLSRLGVRSLLVERHSGTSIHPRARGFNVRTMELFRGLGIDDAVREAGAELAPSGGIYLGRSLAEIVGPKPRKQTGGGRAAMPGDGLIRTVSPTIGARGTQDLVEPVLLAAARADPQADIRFYTECTDFRQDEAGITATIRDRASETRLTVRAQYMIAGDGAGSPVRQKLGITTNGRGVLGHLINILFEADLTEFVRGREFSMCRIERPEVRGLFTSINNSNRWVFHLSYDPDAGQKAEDFSPDRCAELIRIAIGLPNVDIKIKSRLPWQSAVRIAETFRNGRVFLAGDAAHQMPPWGGQGATSGIADVHNLSWKLAAVLHRQAGAALLDTYHTERHPVGTLVAEESGAAADHSGLIAVKISAFIKTIPRLPRILGYGYRYESSAAVPERDTILRVPWHLTAWILDLAGRPGTRVPHLWAQKDGQEVSPVDVCRDTFTLLIAEENKAWRKAASSVADRLGIALPVYYIGPGGDLDDSSQQWPSLAGVSLGGALLVRPDGFVAWRVYHQPSSPSEELHRVMQGILSR